MTAEKDAHRVTAEEHLAASQHATNLQTDLEAVQQELADQTLTCTTAAEKAATSQAELETVGRDVSALQEQLEDALHGLEAEQQRHEDVKQTAEGLQLRVQDVQQELSAERQAYSGEKAQKAEAQQSASSLHCQLQTAQQMLRDREEAHLIAVADLQNESRAAKESLEARMKVAEETVASLQDQPHEAVRGNRSLQEVSKWQLLKVCSLKPKYALPLLRLPL